MGTSGPLVQAAMEVYVLRHQRLGRGELDDVDFVIRHNMTVENTLLVLRTSKQILGYFLFEPEGSY